MALGVYEWTVFAENDGQTLRTFLRQVHGLSARSMSVLKQAGMGIVRDGCELKAHNRLKCGDRIVLRLPPENSDIIPVSGALSVLYEDERLLIVNKPPRVPVHPTKIHQLDTLANLVADYQLKIGESYVFRAMNRLDKDTTGCVLIAKDRIAYSLIQPSVRKCYLAVCEGIIDVAGEVSEPIGPAQGSKIRRCTRPDGAKAITHYEPLAQSRTHTLCRMTLLTGRTHQIRCHMSSIGHPLAGDDLYGGSRELIGRQALHCQSVSFVHPDSRQRITVNSPIPDDFIPLIGTLTAAGYQGKANVF